jgi:hypothetical protein
MTARLLATASILTLTLLAPSCGRAQSRSRQRFPYPTPVWIAAQLVPSPEWTLTRDEVYFGLRWEVTPLLLAFSLRPGLVPWRAFVAEPVVRYGGSIELFVAPEFLALPGELAQQWGLRTGLRTYLPLVSRGESLAAFLGASHFVYRGEHAAGFDFGLCAVMGLFGIQVTYTPRLQGSDAWTFTLRLRYL